MINIIGILINCYSLGIMYNVNCTPCVYGNWTNKCCVIEMCEPENPNVPNPPESLEAIVISGNLVRVSWTPSIGPNLAHGYNVYYGNEPLTRIGFSDAKQNLTKDLNITKPKYISIRAYNKWGYSKEKILSLDEGPQVPNAAANFSIILSE
jgi:hypothetical protein